MPCLKRRALHRTWSCLVGEVILELLVAKEGADEHCSKMKEKWLIWGNIEKLNILKCHLLKRLTKVKNVVAMPACGARPIVSEIKGSMAFICLFFIAYAYLNDAIDDYYL